MEKLLQQLRSISGDANVHTGAADCAYFAQDVYYASHPAAAVVAPASTDELAAAVAVITASGASVVSRGGGMSYTGGYVPAEENAVVIDLSRMNRVLELNREDMYVTVEAGATWAELHRALSGSGLRTPNWGTLSGLYATVGGGLSQNSIFWGSGRHGSVADSVLCMDIVAADGRIVRTGSSAQVNAAPFFRYFGPDLTGLFLADCGALGIKATATLRLIPEMPAQTYGSFAFENYREAVSAMSELSRRNLAAECFGFDPYLQSQRMKRDSLMADMKKLGGVLKTAGGLGKAIRAGAGMAVAGRGFMDDVKWSFHVICEGLTTQSAEFCLEQVREIVGQAGGRELPDSIPRVVRANPFGPVNNMLGPEGERWVPVHGLLPHSRAITAMERIESLFASQRAALELHDINTGYLLATVGASCFVIEPVFFWPDEWMEIHRRSVEPAYLKRLKAKPANPVARELVASVREELVELFSELGAVHLQIGKSYRYREGLHPVAFDLVRAMKNELDPHRRMNPGNLGL